MTELTKQDVAHAYNVPCRLLGIDVDDAHHAEDLARYEAALTAELFYGQMSGSPQGLLPPADDQAHADYLNALRNLTPAETGKCVVCGCTEADCSSCVERTGEPCYWVAPNVCSACVRRYCSAARDGKHHPDERGRACRHCKAALVDTVAGWLVPA